MAPFVIVFSIFLSVLSIKTSAGSTFDKYYSPLWGLNHLSLNPQGNVQLLFDNSSGAGFRSKLDYSSRLFHIRMKIPKKKTGGVVTTFYLTSAPDNQDPGNHFELDYEFLGTNGTVQMNVYDNDEGHREQSFKLWFDPSADFHTYEILWNAHQIVFMVDKIPIRVFRNNKDKGIDYPSKPMRIEASIWNANWAGNVDWSKAPFTAHYQDFDFYSCPAAVGSDISKCDSNQFFWNKNWELNNQQKMQMVKYKRAYMTYDYCTQSATRKNECSLNV